METPIVSIVNGNNADLIQEVGRLYIPDNAVVRDVTWGKGAFWKKLPTAAITLVGSDIDPHIAKDGVVLADFRRLPDADSSADVIVLDPPYVHNPGRHMTDSRYNNAATTSGKSHSDIRHMYRAGMAEAMRILKPGGKLLVKGKDEIESGRQQWSQTELLCDAVSLGLYGKDLFILVPNSRTSMSRWSVQKHARKVHSFLWVFEKPTRDTRRVFHVVDENGFVEQWTAKRPSHPQIGGWVWV
ncbi:Uncharacterised protein [Mycobacteroides abscessus subsp. massiliense]|uniref:hypothetical protein n=1 Tax=Mycobacteroides abscessus TaxID=36809 RepID=UPI0009A6333E|nr:hypothetical protein [Mycobacteroides abscessus]MDO3055619.1 hypothetical protein [Mycobacteroides abscessus subsp. massiliense]SLC37824.1 Uncharacterised protein [Mycobacteroides abscessus subsp. massiliense]SLH10533.1 Uncharacterised protein [Mycobacteroides abscessus subsp. massiliense]SLI03405.1 Uncharacterised protein [Mycobacteroides abscessus subsp. massiliense]